METLVLIEIAATYVMCAVLFSVLGYIAGDSARRKDGKIYRDRLRERINPYPLTAAALYGIDELVKVCHNASVSAGWHHDLKTGERIKRNKAEMICLMHSELSEAMEGIRKNLMDDKLPHRKMAEVELVDCIIRICDFAGMEEYDLSGALVEKLRYNANRADHKPENRLKQGGKQF